MTTTINLSTADALAIDSAPAMTDEEMQRTIDEIRDAIAQSEEKLVEINIDTKVDTKALAQTPIPNPKKKSIE